MIGHVRDSPNGFYVTGGTMQPDAPSYVERQSDKEILESLLTGQFCYALTARQMGKSSLMVCTANRLRECGVFVVVLDLSAVGQNLTPEQWYGGLLNRLGTQLRMEDDVDAFWWDHEQLGPCQRLFAVIEKLILPKLKTRETGTSSPAALRSTLVIFVDELDVVRSLPFSTDEFFAAIRECYNRRTEDHEFKRLTFCLLGVATPSDLIRNTRITPFNIGRRIELNDFTAEEAAPLARGLGPASLDESKRASADSSDRFPVARRTPHDARPLLARILYWTHGHPYLTQRLCQSVATLNASTTEENQLVQTPKAIDRMCAHLFFGRRAREQDDNLLFVRERLLKGDVDRIGLLLLYLQVWKGRKRVEDDEMNPFVNLLRLSGIVRVENGFLRVRNRIYSRVFDRGWVMANLPEAEIVRQRAAFRKGLLVAAKSTAAAMIIMLVAVLIWWQSLNSNPSLVVPTPPPISPNAHDFFVMADKAVVNPDKVFAIGADPSSYSLSERESVLSANQPALETLRMGFRYPYQQPPARSIKNYSYNGVLFRREAFLLNLEASVRMERGDWAGAANSFLDLIHFGEDLPRGAILVGKMLGVAVVDLGQRGLSKTVDHLDAVQARAAAQRLEELRHVPFAATLQEEKWFVQASLLELFRGPDWRTEWIRLTSRSNTNTLDWIKTRVSLIPLSKRRVFERYTTTIDQYIAMAHQPYAARPAAPTVPTGALTAELIPNFTKAWFVEPSLHLSAKFVLKK